MVVSYLLRATVLITIGILIASIITETGIFSRLGFLSRPISRLSALSEPCSFVLLTMVANATAGKSMLAQFFREGKVRKEEVVPTLLMGTFPTVLGESLFRVQLPTAVVLLGPVVGVTYTLLNLLSTLIQVAGAMIYMRLFVGRGDGDTQVQSPEPTPLRLDRATFKEGVAKALPSLRRIVPVAVVATLVFFALYAVGAVTAVAAIFGPVLGLVGVPGESIAAIVAHAAHFSAGYAVVGSLLAEGTLDIEEALVTLVIGSMAVITLIYLKYSAPLYLSLFGREGVKVTIKTYGASMAAKVITIVLILLIF
ncbi:nucleoside recognition protein [Methanofollis aquaemaris]|uniref:Nucleoside recognition protein n=2 Tax=Methanofollis aquaemaris TaxID=126734 RepID=A0A8A3S9L9_9EURY|nr:nucleoside recognition protein [Methanofollis aquaemaris]